MVSRGEREITISGQGEASRQRRKNRLNCRKQEFQDSRKKEKRQNFAETSPPSSREASIMKRNLEVVLHKDERSHSYDVI